MMPRPIADWIALWRDLPRHPRQVLLNRAHFSGGPLAISLALLLDGYDIHPYTAEVLYTLLIVAGPSSLIALTGALAHTFWAHGWIWTDLTCESCGDEGDDDGDDDDLDPQDPDGGGGFALDVENWLKTQPTPAPVH